MSWPLLSICMPTYNFGAFIGETLASIAPQLTPDIEVVVLDGGSLDSTSQVVSPYLRDYPAISYEKQLFRGGIDRDMARSIEIARGDYVWLFSSDDVMHAGALSRALLEIRGGLDLYLCGLTQCDRQMRILHEHPVSFARWSSVYQLADPAARERYFALARTTTAFFSFMGSLIVRRAKWQEGRLEEAYVGSCWAHVARLLRLAREGLSVKYLGESFQLKRGGNDSFMDKGEIHRFGIAIDGFHRVAADVFGERSKEAWHIRRAVANEYPLKLMFYTRARYADQRATADVAEIDRLVTKAFGDPSFRNLLRRLGYSSVARGLFKAARMTIRLLRRLGLARARK